MSFIRPDDVVPSLRHDVFFSRPPDGVGDEVLRLVNLKSGEEVPLRGFEYSLARMLDGHRTAQQVVDSARRIGLPLSLNGLEGFVRKLSSYDLVTDEPEADGDAASPWGARMQWDTQTRDEYRQALKRDRQDAHFAEVFAEADKTWTQDPMSTDDFRIGGSRSSRGLATVAALSVAALGVVAAIGLLVPFPRSLTTPVILQPFSTEAVTAPFAGKVAQVLVRPDQWVEKGDALFSLEPNDIQNELTEAQGRLERQERELSIWLHNAPETRESSERHDRAEVAVARAQAELERSHLGPPSPADQREAEQSLMAALADLHQAEEAMDGELPPEAREALRTAQAEVQRLEVSLLDTEVRAPHAGVVKSLALEPGDEVTAGQAALMLEDTSRLKAIATIPPEKYPGVKVGSPARLTKGDRAIDVSVTRVDQSKVELDLDNAARSWPVGEGELQIKLPPQPLIRAGR